MACPLQVSIKKVHSGKGVTNICSPYPATMLWISLVIIEPVLRTYGGENKPFYTDKRVEVHFLRIATKKS